MPTCGPPLFFLEEVEVNMANAVVAMRSIKACVTRHDVISMANSMQKGTPTAKRFNSESITAGSYQALLS